jgi:DNA end-binding protein Ku
MAIVRLVLAVLSGFVRQFPATGVPEASDQRRDPVRNVRSHSRMVKKKAATAKRPKHRASWKGNLTFGLVAIPVQAFNALNREQSDIHFHQLHSTCHRRIHYEKVCPVHGEVPPDEIVSGYEYRKGRYVEIEPEELDALRTERERSLAIDTFVEPETIDPIYLDGRMYYLVPDSGAEEPYAVMAEAMEREERYGIGQVVFSGKEQLAMVRSVDGVLHMAMLNYDEEIRSPDEVASSIKHPRKINRQVQLAQALIRNWYSRDFDFTEYDDTYRKKVKKLIEAKVEGREIVTPGEEVETPEVINLMDALKKSVAQTTHHGNGNGRGKRSRRRRA